jgi:hypothetical protein
MAGSIGSLLLRGFVTVCVVGLVLGVVVPLLNRNGITPPEWVVWIVIGGVILAVVGPTFWAERKTRKERVPRL